MKTRRPDKRTAHPELYFKDDNGRLIRYYTFLNARTGQVFKDRTASELQKIIGIGNISTYITKVEDGYEGPLLKEWYWVRDEVKTYPYPYIKIPKVLYREHLGRLGGTEPRYWVSAFNTVSLKKRYMLRAQYSYLKGSGRWDRGETTIPRGYVVHHIDRNPLNDSYENLDLLTVSEHRILHDSIDSTRREGARQRSLAGVPQRRVEKLGTN